MEANSSQDSIQVFIRIKPLQQQQNVLAFTETQIKLDRHQFAFDKIFPPSANQTDIFHHVGNKLLNNVLDGYNSCVFVYGQTGSGKTHTMIGQNNGLMQQSFQQLFSRINRLKNAECFVTCSYFQLYNEQIMDLLDPKKQKKLNIRQDAKKGVFVQNLVEQTALDCERLMDVLYTGMKNRHIGETQMNRESSRSHSVFTISLSCKTEEDGKKVLKTPKLHFVDLAGAEKQKMTQSSGDRLKQAGNINKSLTTLGMVINALTSQKPRSHIPYRDSKLTCLLRDSLGGNSKTIIIATVASTALSFQQSLSTLNFANRAKMVKVKALINEESLSTNLEVFKEQIRRLKGQIARLKSEHHRTPIKVITHQIMSPKQISSQFQHHFDEINKKITAISQQLTQGVTSPSLQALLSNLNTKKTIGSVETMMDQQNCEQNQSNEGIQKSNPIEFIEYLNSNYELLTQINTKVNQYLEIKQELRNSAINKKLTIQNMRTPSKFQRDQYEELLAKREDQIQNLQQKTQLLERNLNLAIIEKKDYERKLQMHKQTSSETGESILKIKDALLQTENQLEKEKVQSQRLKNQICRVEKIVQQLQKRLKQTKELHLYAQQKYENEKFISSKLNSKIDQFERQLQHHKKISLTLKNQTQELSNQIQNLKLALEDKQSSEQQLRNELSEMEETLEFNKRMMEEMTKKNSSLNNELAKIKQHISSITTKNDQLNEQNSRLSQKLNSQMQVYGSQLQQKTIQIKQISLNNDKLNHQIMTLHKELLEQRRIKQLELSKNREHISEINRLMFEKQSQLTKSRNQYCLIEQSINRLKSQNQAAIQNYSIKIQAKIIECSMVEQTYNQYKASSQNLTDQLKKQLQSTLAKANSLTQQKLKVESQNTQMKSKLKDAQTKLSSIQHIFSENQQLKKSYKQLVKQNYRLKGKYQTHNQNQELQKQKNDQLLSKVQFYQEKFKLMSMEYQKIQGIVKKLKEKQLEANKKIQFFEESIKLRGIQKGDGDDLEERNALIYQLKEQNRQLKYKLDNLEGNLMQNKKDQSNLQSSSTSKKSKQQRQSFSLIMKCQKFKAKLTNLMKNWQGFANQSSQQHSTQEMIDLCEVMINQNTIRFETIAKGIRRQQKLKSQNHFILKQNIYLKQKLEQMEKKQSTEDKQLQIKPRKLVKSD